MSQQMVHAGQQGLAQHAFSSTSYKVTRPWLSFLGRKFYVYAPDGSLAAYVKKPVFKLKQEFTIYANENETQPILTVRQRQFIGLNMTFSGKIYNIINFIVCKNG